MCIYNIYACVRTFLHLYKHGMLTNLTPQTLSSCELSLFQDSCMQKAQAPHNRWCPHLSWAGTEFQLKAMIAKFRMWCDTFWVEILSEQHTGQVKQTPCLTHPYFSYSYHTSQQNEKHLMSLHQMSMLFQNFTKWTFFKMDWSVYSHVLC